MSVPRTWIITARSVHAWQTMRRPPVGRKRRAPVSARAPNASREDGRESVIPAVIYARVSSELQAVQGGGLEDQVRACCDLCEREGWEVRATYRDEGISGATENRPAFQQALQAVPSGGILVVDRYDRLSRDARYRLQLADELARRGIAIVSPHGRVDIESAAGFLVYGIDSVVSEHYRRLIGERTARAFQRRRKQGQQHGGTAPYGYTWGPEGELIPQMEHARVLRQIFAWAQEGIGKSAIAGRLNKAGITRPDGKQGLWQDATIKDILLNPVYLGFVCHRFRKQVSQTGKTVWRRLPADKWEIFEGSHQAIIDRDQFEQVQSMLRSRSWRVPTNYGHQFLLTGLLHCPHCGGRMHGSHQRMGSRRYPTYRCSTHIHSRTCRSTCRGAEKWERAFIDELEAILAGERILDQSWHYGSARPSSEIEETEAELAALSSRRAAIFEALETRQWPLEVLRQRLDRIEGREVELKRKRVEAQGQQTNGKPPIRLQGLREVLMSRDIPVAQKRAALAEVVERIDWREDGGLEITFHALRPNARR